jgi:hypothetical protein
MSLNPSSPSWAFAIFATFADGMGVGRVTTGRGEL